MSVFEFCRVKICTVYLRFVQVCVWFLCVVDDFIGRSKFVVICLIRCCFRRMRIHVGFSRCSWKVCKQLSNFVQALLCSSSMEINGIKFVRLGLLEKAFGGQSGEGFHVNPNENFDEANQKEFEAMVNRIVMKVHQVVAMVVPIAGAIKAAKDSKKEVVRLLPRSKS